MVLFGIIFDIATGVSIVVTLVILVLELRAHKKTMRYQIENNRIDRLHDIVDSPYIPEIVEKVKAVDSNRIHPATDALMKRYDLTFVEADRLQRHLGQIWTGVQADFNYGLVDAAYVADMFNYPDMATYWDNAYHFDRKFARFVERVRRRVHGKRN